MHEVVSEPVKPFHLRLQRTDGYVVAIDSIPGSSSLRVVVSHGEQAWAGTRDTVTAAVELAGKICADRILINLMHEGDKHDNDRNLVLQRGTPESV